MRPFVEVGCDIPLLGPMTGRSRPHLSLREGLEQTPFPLALHRIGSVLAVKGSLRRFAPWTAPGRSERRAAHVPTLQLLDIHGSSYDILDLLEIGFHGGVARYNN